VYVSEDVKVLGANGKSNAVPTVQCETFVPDALSGKFGFEDPNLGMDKTSMQQYVNDTSPSFWISLHNKMFDFPRWGIKTSGKYYKVHLEDIWRNILSHAARGGHVLDIGSNIGYFTLLSLAMGDFVVHAFEPNSVNFLRLCESLQLNGWTTRATDPKGPRLFMYDAGVSDRDEALPFQANKENPGASQFLNPTAPDFQYKAYVRKDVVSLDSYAQRQGWLEATTSSSSTTAKSSPPTIPILKIDVEGMEHRVLSGAAKLLRTRAVQNVFLELSVRDPQEALNSNIALSALVNAGYALAGIGNWAGPGQGVPWKADGANLIARVLDHAEKQDSKQLHVWFQVNQ
jgi:FkbM family methyltransferase